VVKIREAVGRLKELRAPLISAAVTGKIDVREAVSESQSDRDDSTDPGESSIRK
jgi:hypothetical protein